MKKESLFLETIDITSLYRSDAFVTDVGAKLKIKQIFSQAPLGLRAHFFVWKTCQIVQMWYDKNAFTHMLFNTFKLGSTPLINKIINISQYRCLILTDTSHFETFFSIPLDSLDSGLAVGLFDDNIILSLDVSSFTMFWRYS